LEARLPGIGGTPEIGHFVGMIDRRVAEDGEPAFLLANASVLDLSTREDGWLDWYRCVSVKRCSRFMTSFFPRVELSISVFSQKMEYGSKRTSIITMLNYNFKRSEQNEDVVN
jgi:hypothetical protein